jgi:hypothetical protein
MDMVAHRVGVTPEEVRLRNYINGGELFEEFEAASTLTFDSGHYKPAHDRALELLDVAGLRQEQARRREAGGPVQLGVGMCTYVEICGLAPSRALGGLNYGAGGWKHVTVRILPTGKVEVCRNQPLMVRAMRRRGPRSLPRSLGSIPTMSRCRIPTRPRARSASTPTARARWPLVGLRLR